MQACRLRYILHRITHFAALAGQAQGDPHRPAVQGRQGGVEQGEQQLPHVRVAWWRACSVVPTGRRCYTARGSSCGMHSATRRSGYKGQAATVCCAVLQHVLAHSLFALPYRSLQGPTRTDMKPLDIVQPEVWAPACMWGWGLGLVVLVGRVRRALSVCRRASLVCKGAIAPVRYLASPLPSMTFVLGSPQGPSFSVEGQLVRWHNWTFRLGFNYRCGS